MLGVTVSLRRKRGIVYTYRIVIDGYNTMPAGTRSARVVTYSQGYDRTDALRRIRSLCVAQDGTVSDGIRPWPGTRNMPAGNVAPRTFREWSVVSMRSVRAAGRPHILAEG